MIFTSITLSLFKLNLKQLIHMNNNNNAKNIVVVCESFGDRSCECGFCCNDG
ncbi:MAG TPA: hypothetical protein VJ583_11525 [Nitrososphaeraceae archaeon]|nr:hypothetical protein [Nitrososphaeraceae archaeon]